MEMESIVLEQELEGKQTAKLSYTVIEEMDDNLSDTFETQRTRPSNGNGNRVVPNFGLFQVSPVICNFNANPDVIGETVYTCGIGNCRSKFQSESFLYQHFRLAHKLSFMCSNNDTINSHCETAASISQERKRKERKERKYPCGYPGCQWVFTRTNHVARHHERVHPGFKPLKTNPEIKNKKTNSYVYGPVLHTPSILRKHKKPIRSEQKLVDKSNNKVIFPVKSDSVTILPEKEHNVYICEESNCNMSFPSKKEYNEHLFRVHSVVEPEICLHVEDKEWIGDENRRSMETLSKEQNERFLEDNMYLSTFEPLKYLRPPRPYICDIPGCEKTYTKHSHLIRHKVETHKMEKPPPKSAGRGQITTAPQPESDNSPTERPFPCDFPGCGWSFKRQYHLNRHIVTHNNKFLSTITKDCFDAELNGDEINDEWSAVSDSFKFNVNLNDSQTANTVVIEEMSDDMYELKSTESFVCDFPSCGRTFKQKALLDEHYVVHSGPSLVIDGSESTKSDVLKDTDAEEFHSESLVECVLQEINEESALKTCYEQNGSMSPQITNCDELKHRKRKSTEKRTFVCDIPGCAKKFGRNCELTRHKLNHTDVWPFRCNYVSCGRKFKRKDVFKNHQRTHGREFRDSKESDSSDSWPKTNFEDKISPKKENVDSQNDGLEMNSNES